MLTANGIVAQLVERWSEKPQVSGSCPLVTTVLLNAFVFQSGNSAIVVALFSPFEGIETRLNSLLAQRLERSPVKREVSGSRPLK